MERADWHYYSSCTQDDFTVDPMTSMGPWNSYFVRYLLNGIVSATRCFHATEDEWLNIDYLDLNYPDFSIIWTFFLVPIL